MEKPAVSSTLAVSGEMCACFVFLHYCNNYVFEHIYLAKSSKVDTFVVFQKKPKRNSLFKLGVKSDYELYKC